MSFIGSLIWWLVFFAVIELVGWVFYWRGDNPHFPHTEENTPAAGTSA